MDIKGNMIIFTDGESDLSDQYVVLPKGEYGFAIEEARDGIFTGSTKLPKCEEIVMRLLVDNRVHINYHLRLSPKLWWLIRDFVHSVRLKPGIDGKLRLDASTVIGRKGRAIIAPNVVGYTTYNSIVKFLAEVDCDDDNDDEVPFA